MELRIILFSVKWMNEPMKRGSLIYLSISLKEELMSNKRGKLQMIKLAFYSNFPLIKGRIFVKQLFSVFIGGLATVN